jgi:hypothetical protein
MNYYRLDATGHFLEHADDSQHGEPPLGANLFYTTPKEEFVITSSSAAMFSANSSMSYLEQLPRGGRIFTDLNPDICLMLNDLLLQYIKHYLRSDCSSSRH